MQRTTSKCPIKIKPSSKTQKSLCKSTNNKSGQKSELFDVTMSAYDGAEVYELVEIFILYQLAHKYNKNNANLYRDDNLAAFRNISDPRSEKIKKHIHNIFLRNILIIFVKCRLKIVDYLLVALNLSDD